jgi:hypothetical protein
MAKAASLRSSLWSFVRRPANWAVIVGVVTALWAVFVYLVPPHERSVQSNCGGIAVGRDITGSSVRAGDCIQTPK